MTATPERLDGKGLDDFYDGLIQGPGIAELIGLKFLSPFTAFIPAQGPDLTGVRTLAGDYQINDLSRAMSKGVVISAAVDEYIKRCVVNGVKSPAIAFAVDIAHGKRLAKRVNASMPNHPAAVQGDQKGSRVAKRAQQVGPLFSGVLAE